MIRQPYRQQLHHHHRRHNSTLLIRPSRVDCVPRPRTHCSIPTPPFLHHHYCSCSPLATSTATTTTTRATTTPLSQRAMTCTNGVDRVNCLHNTAASCKLYLPRPQQPRPKVCSPPAILLLLLLPATTTITTTRRCCQCRVGATTIP
jgi:hypothetical protein